jgi:phosphotriesterase-related protein
MAGAAIASLESGYLIEMHTEKGAGAKDYLDFFIERDLPTNRLVFCHMDKRPDYELHKELAQAGCLLEYDTFFREKYLPEKNLWPLLQKIVEAGYGKSIVCATDLADSSQWRSYGGSPGLSGFVIEIKQQMEKKSFHQDTINDLLGGNITAHLAIDIKENTI